jgi:hypothetical protein
MVVVVEVVVGGGGDVVVVVVVVVSSSSSSSKSWHVRLKLSKMRHHPIPFWVTKPKHVGLDALSDYARCFLSYVIQQKSINILEDCNYCLDLQG